MRTVFAETVTFMFTCRIENVIFINLGLTGTNLIGNSYLTKIMIKLNVGELVFFQGITLNYWGEEYKDHKHLLILNQINTTV